MSCPSCESIKLLSGDPGQDGQYGGYSSKWQFDNNTAAGPAVQFLRLNNGTYTAVSQIYINETNADSVNVAAFLATINSHANYGYIRIFKEFDSSVFWMGKVTGFTDNGSDITLNVTYILHNGSFSANDNLVFTFSADSGAPPIAPVETLITLGKELENTDPSWVADDTYYSPTGYGTLTYSNSSGVTKIYKVTAEFNSGTVDVASQGKTDVTGAIFLDTVVQRESKSKITYADAGGDATAYDVRQGTSITKIVTALNGQKISLQFKTKASGGGYINSGYLLIEDITQ